VGADSSVCWRERTLASRAPPLPCPSSAFDAFRNGRPPLFVLVNAWDGFSSRSARPAPGPVRRRLICSSAITPARNKAVTATPSSIAAKTAPLDLKNPSSFPLFSPELSFPGLSFAPPASPGDGDVLTEEELALAPLVGKVVPASAGFVVPAEVACPPLTPGTFVDCAGSVVIGTVVEAPPALAGEAVSELGARLPCSEFGSGVPGAPVEPGCNVPGERVCCAVRPVSASGGIPPIPLTLGNGVTIPAA